MSKKEELTGKFFMGKDLKPEQRFNIIKPEEPFKNEIDKLKKEKEEQEMAKLLLELEKSKQEEINQKLSKLEMIPMFNKIVILPYPRNPYRKIVEGSILVDYSGDFLNPDSGEQDKLKELVGCAKVIEVGPECKYLNVGDDVYYDTRTVYPVPFMSLGYVLCSETQILCNMNESLKERYNKNK